MGKYTVIIKPGEKVILPQNAVVTSVVLDGAIDVESTCNNLPTPSTFKCGYFWLTLDYSTEEDHSMDERYTYYRELKVANNTYVINRRVIDNDDNPGDLTSVSALNTHVPDQGLFKFMDIRRDLNPAGEDFRQIVWVFFRTVEEVWDQIELKMDNRGSIHYYKPIEEDCGSYPEPVEA